MKKILFALGVIILLPISAVYCAELVLDLNNGTIAGLKVGIQADRNAIKSAIGQEPGDVEERSYTSFDSRFYKFYNCGLSLGTTIEGANETIDSFGVNLKPGEGKDINYQKFSGKILPTLSASDDINSAKDKLGPSGVEETLSEKAYALYYQKTFGYLTLFFDENKKLSFIEVSLEQM